MTLTQKLFGFSGRLRRGDYWALILASTFVFGFTRALINAFTTSNLNPDPTVGIGNLVLIPGLWVGIAVTLKRAHDRDRDWPWLLLYYIPIVGWVCSFIDLGLIDGTQGSNRFGPSPKGIGHRRKSSTETVRFLVRHRAAKRQVLLPTPLSAELHERLPEKVAADTSEIVISPMPGVVVTMDVAVGQVAADEVLVEFA